MLLALLAAGAGACADDLPRVTIAGTTVIVEVADSPAQMQQGLSGRPFLEDGRGMIFPYTTAGYPGFWMRGMKFDLDIVWIRGERVVDIHERVPHRADEPLPVYRPAAPADRVLEVPAGFAARSGWRIGDRVRTDY